MAYLEDQHHSEETLEILQQTRLLEAYSELRTYDERELIITYVQQLAQGRADIH